MKTLNIIILGVMIPMLGFSQVKAIGESRTKPDDLKGTVKVLAAPELSEISTLWANAFDAMHDQLNVKLDIENSVELGHIIRSFDSCMVCCVHKFDKLTQKGRILL